MNGGRHSRARSVVAFGAAVVLGVAACGPAPTHPTDSALPSATESAIATGANTTGANATGTPAATTAPPSVSARPAGSLGPFVAANVQVAGEMVTKVNGSLLAIAVPDDGSGRLFVESQQGQIWSVVPGGATREMLDLSATISYDGGERGLLGLALHPGFPRDPRAFVNYTDPDGNTVIASFEVTADGSAFEPTTRHVILRQQQPYPNHNGCGVMFGPDGYMYVALGDGGSGGDPDGNGQNLGTFLAKMLRIDVDHPAAGRAYAIPSDNPFVKRSGAKPEIWLYGLRNPFRFSFDRGTGDLWIADVGQERWEEVDVIRAGDPGGENLGWNVMEGSHCFQPADGCNTKGMTLPISEYGHDQGCAIIGGNVYRGSAYPMLVGGYLFTDSCSATLWAIPASTKTPVQPVPVGEIGGSPAGFGEDPAGQLYVARLDGTIWKLTATTR